MSPKLTVALETLGSIENLSMNKYVIRNAGLYYVCDLKYGDKRNFSRNFTLSVNT